MGKRGRGKKEGSEMKRGRNVREEGRGRKRW
jgi:hypothetical protein